MDYRCGYCKKAYDEVSELVESDGNIKFIVKEFPILGEHEIAVGIAADPADAVLEQRRRIVGDEVVVGHGLGLGLAAFQHADGFHQHFGVFQQVVADLGAELAALGIGHPADVEGHCRGGDGRGKAQACQHAADWGHRGSHLFFRVSRSAESMMSCARAQPGEPTGRAPAARRACRSALSSWPISAYRSAV